MTNYSDNIICLFLKIIRFITHIVIGALCCAYFLQNSCRCMEMERDLRAHSNLFEDSSMEVINNQIQDDLNAFSIISPVTALNHPEVPEISTTSQNKLVKMSNCFFNQVHLLDSSGNIVLTASSGWFGWNIFLPTGEKAGKLTKNITGTKYYLNSSFGNCLIKYFNVYSNAGPRVFHVYADLLIESQKKKESLQERVRKKSNEYAFLINKPPYFNYESNSYVLNFNGRVTMPSSRNFQVIHPKDTSYITITFGKIAQNEYILDYSYPWTPVQALSIALSSFSWKLGG
ncbi:tubby [Nematocida ausubeli]|nr:tubby [Nematocida ausubeli]